MYLTVLITYFTYWLASEITEALNFSFIRSAILSAENFTTAMIIPPIPPALMIAVTANGTLSINGSTVVTFNSAASIKPTITGITATRVDGTVPSSWGIFVQTKSKVTLTITGATGAGGSTISSYSITGGGLSYTASSVTTGFLNTSGSITFTGKVCDSRGRWSDEATVTINVVAYSAPRFNSYSTQRCTSTGASSSNGTYAKSTIGFSYWSCSGKNTITTAVAYKKSSDSSYTNAGVTFTSGTQFIFGGGNLSVD